MDTKLTAIKDFVFDLHSCSRNSMREEDVVSTYEIKFKDLSEIYFQQSAWPDVRTIASECYNDEEFLLFYREMTMRHLFMKLKPQTNHFIDSWTNYTKLFSFILNSKEETILLTSQWIYDIIQEFVYQFQGFCQFRSQVTHRTSDDIIILNENKKAWNLPTVVRILRDLFDLSNKYPSSSIFYKFGTFAAVELARLECLLGDYTSSLRVFSTTIVNDRLDLIKKLPSSYLNAFYHVGVSYLLLRRYTEAMDCFSEIVLSMQTQGLLKPPQPASGYGSQQRSLAPLTQSHRILDKILGLLAIAMVLSPANRLDEQVRELVESKLSEKLRRMSGGDGNILNDLFEQSCPKFVSPIVPNYNSSINHNQEAFIHQLNIFAEDAKQQLDVLKLRPYLRLYTAIHIDKLARITDSNTSAFTAQLLAYSYRTISNSSVNETRSSSSDVSFVIHNNSLVIETASSSSIKNNAIERYFIAGVRKHSEIASDLSKNFAKLGL